MRVEHRGGVVFERAYGVTKARGGTPIAVDTRFDLASLTKPIVATVALGFVVAGRLALDAPLLDLVPEWSKTDRAAITLRRILAHDAGFASGADYRAILDENVEAYALFEAPLVAQPGERAIYSDLGYIALGAILERAGRASLASIVRRALHQYGVPSFEYRPRGAERARIPATEEDTWRGLVQGTVHDEKAHLMGGVAGHAGLFGNARDVARIAAAYLRPSPAPGGLLAREATREQAPDAILRRGLGWALKTRDDNSCGAKMGPNTFGHTGFTGTSVWTDPDRELIVVLLTNAVHFGRRDIRDLRAAVCDAAVDFSEAACARSA
ncbi:MAG: beta-lactamase family protein [Candidatus Eremiobacteraeota bacterium]|nr:beta-lactamase family protein [Candidatus Eremiobacteraeota bacterium]MBV8353677.1 beta-lactamase family protein [Candidatus Eremiobacteraeota bacterium]